MLSDTLATAIWEMEDYQKEFSEMYAPHKEEIDQVKEKMRELQRKLDSLDSPEVNPKLSPFQHNL